MQISGRAPLVAGFALLVSIPAIADTPKQLLGKSISVTYVNVSSLRPAGTNKDFHITRTSRQLIIYVSTEGRIFARFGTNRKTKDQVGSSGVGKNGSTEVKLDGSALVVSFGFANGATRIQVDFDAEFSRCAANVLHGKVSGASSYLYKNAAGKMLEIRASQATNIKCSISSSNVFAN